MPSRSVFFVSDGTGITAETFGNSVLAQFDIRLHHVRLPFINTPELAHEAVKRINTTATDENCRPIVFTTLVNEEVLATIKNCNGLVLDMFSIFFEPIERELGLKSRHRIGGRFDDITKTIAYHDRIEAVNFSLAHDDGQSIVNLAAADVILVGISRCGKTPTALYLAMQYGVKAANYPLVPDDFERQQLPSLLNPWRTKLFGLTIAPDRLSEIRNERRPSSTYASLKNCQYEVTQAERLMRREQIRWLSSTNKSIEEIATTILQLIKPERLEY